MKMYSNAVEDYLERVVTKSWTWKKLTVEERQRFLGMDVFDRIKGNDDTRIQWLSTIYLAYLTGLGYKPIDWREETEIKF